MFSVIVPVYNVEKYLYKCIGSILSQTYTDFELLLIDDGSTDQSGIICEKFASMDRRISVIHKVNEGVGSARNIGLERADRCWITFIDSDDYVEPDYFENVSDTILKHNNADSVICPNIREKLHYFFTRITDRLCETERFVKTSEIFIKTSCFGKSSCGVYSKFYKTSIIRKNNIKFENTSKYEDCLFNLSYYKYTDNVYFLNKAYYHYMIDLNPVSLTRLPGKPQEYIISANEAYSQLCQLFDRIKFEEQFQEDIFMLNLKKYTKGITSIYQYSEKYSVRKALFSEYIKLLDKFNRKLRTPHARRFAISFLSSNLVPFPVKDFFIKIW